AHSSAGKSPVKRVTEQNLTKNKKPSHLKIKLPHHSSSKDLLKMKSEKLAGRDSRRNSKSSSSMMKKKKKKLSRVSRSASRSRPESPISPTALMIRIGDGAGVGPYSPAKPGKLSSNRRLTQSGHTYDIDNIVIDPSVAAVSRVEKLQYKEIAIPG